MNSLFEDGEPREMHTERTDRELTLGTGTLLGIFFALALVCAVFFGFGYTMGRRSAQAVAAAPIVDGGAHITVSKPAAGSPANQPLSSYSKQAAADTAAAPASSYTPPVTQPAASAAPAAKPPVPTPAPPPVNVAETRPRTEAAPATLTHPDLAPKPAPPAAPAMVAPGTPGSAIVQIAAVSHQEDADVLLAALKRRGYAVAIHQEPQDKLLHVQIGPFATHKDADLMKQRLLADGYNAIVK